MMTAHDLLDEPLLSWRDERRRRSMTTLPGLIAKLASGELADFPRARAHQFHPWSMFLTQLAAIALHRAGKSDPRLAEVDWRTLLLDLTDGAHEPWCLVVEDPSKPAFMQPPVPEGTIATWSRSDHPDNVDVLVTSKGHDVKSSLVSADFIEGWILALATLQTMQGYPGRGYNRVSRMKGGYGSRPRVGASSGHSPAGRFTRDVRVLLGSWNRLIERGYATDGVALVWTEAWDGKSTLAMSQLSPHFVEVCWRVRIEHSHGGLVCAYTTTQNRRCMEEIENGDVGDPWIPIERGGGGALTVGRRGFHYQLLTRVLFEGEFEPAEAQVINPADPDPVYLLASVMARGQGKTEGLHERELALPSGARRRLGHPDTRAAMGVRATNRVEQAKKMRSKVLSPALKSLALSESVVEDRFDAKVLLPALERLALDKSVVEDRFDAQVDEVFFDDLFSSLDQADAEAQLAWDRRLDELAWKELQHAIDRCCVPAARWYEAVSKAESTFRANRSKEFPTLVASLNTARSQEAHDGH